MNSKFLRSVHTSLILQQLKQATPEQPLVTTEQLCEVSGCTPENVYPYARSAINALMADENKVFVRVRGVGWKLAEADEEVNAVKVHLDRAKSSSKRALRVHSAVKVDKLSPPAQVQHRVSGACIGAMLMFMSTKAQAKLTAAASAGPVDPGRVLEVVK